MLKTSLLFCGIALSATSASAATMELTLIGKVYSYSFAAPEVGSYIEVDEEQSGFNVMDAVDVTDNLNKEIRLTFTYDSDAVSAGSSSASLGSGAVQALSIWVGDELVSSSTTANSEYHSSFGSIAESQSGGEFEIFHNSQYFTGNRWSWIGITDYISLGYEASIEDNLIAAFDVNQTINVDNAYGGSISLFSHETAFEAYQWEYVWFSQTDIGFSLSQIVISGAAAGEVDPGDTTPAPVPLPAGGALLAGGLLALAGYRRRK